MKQQFETLAVLQALNHDASAGGLTSAAPKSGFKNSDLGPLRVACSSATPEQAAPRDDWDRLAGPNPLRGYDWLCAWWRHYGRPNQRPWTVTVRNEAGQLVGLLPAWIGTSLVDGRVVELLGSGHVCSDYLGLMTAPGCEQAVAAAVAHWLGDAIAGSWDVLKLEGVALNDPATTAMFETLRLAGHEVITRQPYSTWRIPLPGTWEEYIARLSNSRRDKVKQMTRRYLDSGRVVPHIVETVEQMERVWPLFCDLHQRRRQMLGESGCFASSNFADFHTEMAHCMLAQGKLRLHWIEFEGRPAAADYALIGDKTIFGYQCGFDPEFSKHKPGWLNTIASLKRAIADGYEVFDFLRGDEPYKASWRAEPCPLIEVRIVGRHASARLRHRLRSFGTSMRDRWRAFQTRRQPTPDAAPAEIES